MRWRYIITGSKSGTTLRSVAQVRKIKVFISRLEADISPETLKPYVREILNDDCTVEKLNTRFPTYSSFLVTCDARHTRTILNCEEWEEGVLIRRFVGNLISASEDSSDGVTSHTPNHDG